MVMTSKKVDVLSVHKWKEGDWPDFLMEIDNNAYKLEMIRAESKIMYLSIIGMGSLLHLYIVLINPIILFDLKSNICNRNKIPGGRRIKNEI